MWAAMMVSSHLEAVSLGSIACVKEIACIVGNGAYHGALYKPSAYVVRVIGPRHSSPDSA
jgi:hypothetical protein